MWLPIAVSLLSAAEAAAPDAGVACVELEQRLAESQRTLAACTENGRSLGAAIEQCKGRGDELSEKLGATSGQLESCVAAKEQQCHDTAVMAAALLNGNAKAVNSCVLPSTVAQIQTLLDGWFALEKSLKQLDDYASGASDLLPQTPGPTESERHLARVLGTRSGAPLWNRRLLIEALRLTAPGSWARLKGQGAAAIEAFFTTRSPLPEQVVLEARSEHAEEGGLAGPPLTAALRLSLAYVQISNCDHRTSSAECARARQLVDLLDGTGPLIVRRRVEEILATPCSSVTPQTIGAWLQDFPATARDKGSTQLQQLSQAAKDKLFHCYLADPEGDPSYLPWVTPRLPAPEDVAPKAAGLIDELRTLVKDGEPLDRCGRAVRAMQQLTPPAKCELEAASANAIGSWAELQRNAPDDPHWSLCHRVASMLWNGESPIIPTNAAAPVRVDDRKQETPIARLRAACAERKGTSDSFESSLNRLASIANELGEPVNLAPWRYDVLAQLPVERVRLEREAGVGPWLENLLSNERPCDSLNMARARCDACKEGASAGYDCELHAQLRDEWQGFNRAARAAGAGVVAALVVWVWTARQRKARKVFGPALRLVRAHLEGLGLLTVPAAFSWLFPSRRDRLEIELPRTPIWERWGPRACAVIAPGTNVLREADVNHAATVALRDEVRVAFLLHSDQATPELGAVRATLDWAARGGSRSVQVLPLPLSRLTWATRETDLLDLVESTTLRGNPFDVRGPVRSSSQFWNRERLVAGLLTQARTGNWVAITGLRRFGKSSLALEVARRTNGPAAYVDLAGFHHEVAFGDGPAEAVEAVLRTLLMRLAESARERFPAAEVPGLPTGSIDAPTLASFLARLAGTCGRSSGQAPPPILLVFDEVEQMLSAAPENLGRALDVLSTLVGRLRSAVANPSSPHASTTASAFFCAAMHPLLWAPLSALGGQSLMGALPSVSVPALEDDAARSMMNGLGARQGIRFEEEALTALVAASQGVPLLLRRLGSAVLELFDPDRARAGALGAVRVGLEGVGEAIKKEERGGSPLRVWVESEIAGHDSVAGAMLRSLARAGRVSAVELVRLAEARVLESFAAGGLNRHLSPSELLRRAQEAASVMVRLLAESKLLAAHGDVTAPEAYSLPDGVLRRILSEEPP